MGAVNFGCACDSGLMIGRVMRSSKRKVQRGINSRVDGGYRADGWGFGGRSPATTRGTHETRMLSRPGKSIARRFAWLADWLTEHECDD
jgi:hypothetical protein